MIRHVVTAGAVMAIGLVPLLYVWRRHGEGARTLRRFAIGFAVLLGVVVALSAGASVTRTRCPDDPTVMCEYNDSTPAMATIAVVFTIAACVRAWMLYAER